MICSLTTSDLCSYVEKQLNYFFPDKNVVRSEELQSSIKEALERLEICLSKVADPYIQKENGCYFNHLHSDCYSMFLYFLSNSHYRNERDEQQCEKIFYLNKALHGLDCFYRIELPEVFLFVHPLGTILGNASYANYFLVSQNCTIGDNFDGNYPVFEEGVAMYAGSSVIGASRIGKNCELAAGSMVYKIQVPNDSLVQGRHPDLKVIQARANVVEKHFLRA